MAGSGKRLKRARRELGLSAAELCRRSGLTTGEVSLWEVGKREVPRTDRVRRGLARGLGKDLALVVAYLEGGAPFGTLFPPPPPPLEQAIACDTPGRWSPSTIEMAKSLEPEFGALTAAEWVRRLDQIQAEKEALLTRLRARWDDDA